MSSVFNNNPKKTSKDSLQVPETCKENQDSFTSLEKAAYEYSFESRPSIYGQVDVIDAFIAGAEWQKSHLTVEDIKTILDLSFWNNDPQKILEEYNRLCDTSKVTRR